MYQFDMDEKYNHNSFVKFLSDFLPDSFEPANEQIYFNFARIDGKGNSRILGKCEELDLEVFELLYTSGYDPRVSLTKDVVNYMKNVSSCSNALVVLYSNESQHWRLSLITTDYAVNNGKIARTYSNPHRLSFLLGKDCKKHTPTSMLFDNGKVVSLDDLTSRFDIEVVSKEFFNLYREKYADFVEYITGKRFVKVGGKFEEKVFHEPNEQYFSQFESDDKAVRDYVKKLFGRLVFLHFLQKKGWLGVEENREWGTGDKQFMFNLYSNCSNKDSYLESVLEPLFFDTLNNDRGIEAIAPAPICKAYGRKIRIPYLNGGLFERDNLDSNKVVFPNSLFSELLEFYDTYNFTIDETDPSDKEIGVDPEMLGKIFENLLEDNKDKGAFYTPKEIVQYMCRESLIAYLLTKVNVTEPRIRNFVLNLVCDFTSEEKALINKALAEVKICDPAVGSGAFPMGLMNELLSCRSALQDTFTKLQRVQLKKEIIKNNIYGVDIEKGAVDIARLRFWLAIIVDEDSPVLLPNLDYKIMQGNSLLESYQGIDLSTLLSNDESYALFNDSTEKDVLLKLIKDFFEPQNQESKDRLREKINDTVFSMLKEKSAGKKDGLKNLKELNLYANTDFFMWHTWFNDVFNRSNNCKGFDIVIGNPPYIQLQENQGKLAKYYKPYNFDTFSGTGDIYCLFIENGFKLLKHNGHLCFITSNKWMRAAYGKSLRKFLATKTNPLLLLDLGSGVFENATVDTDIILVSNTQNKYHTVACNISNPKQIESCYVYSNKVVLSFDSSDSWIILNPIEASIKEKIEKYGKPLGKWDIKINYGIKTGLNEAFIISTEKRNEILNNCKTEDERIRTDELIRPILRGRDIKRNSFNWANLWLIATFPSKHYDINNFQSVKEYLLSFGKEVLEQSGKKNIGGINGKNARKKTNNKWFETQDSISYWDDFSKPKLLYTPVNSEYFFCVDKDCYMVNNAVFIITGKIDMEKICFLLNSQLIKFYLRLMTTDKYQYGSKDLFVTIPIQEIDKCSDDSVFTAYKISENERLYIQSCIIQ